MYGQWQRKIQLEMHVALILEHILIDKLRWHNLHLKGVPIDPIATCIVALAVHIALHTLILRIEWTHRIIE